MALVSVLAAGDYLLWNWSLQSGHDILALISGLTLVLLAIALIWLMALNAGRLLARLAQRSSAGSSARAVGAPRPERREPPVRAGEMAAQQRKGGEPASSSSKLAA